MRSDEQDWKQRVQRVAGGWYELHIASAPHVVVRLFLDDALLNELDPLVYAQIVAATQFRGTRCVVVTPDVHVGYGVPVGCVIATDRDSGAVALGPVGFDIGCGMVSARSRVPAPSATYDRRLEFNREVMARVALGAGEQSLCFAVTSSEFMHYVRGGADAYAERHALEFDRTRTERQSFPVDPQWEPPWGGKGCPERGMAQLGSLGGGNHFIELQRGVGPGEDPRQPDAGELYVQIHTGSRGFGHGMATNYFALARDERPELGANIDLGFFEPDSPHYRGYLNAVAAGANYALVNRLIIYEQVRAAFRKVFRADLELVYELSHNLVQAEAHPEFGDVWVHRKGATRAFPAAHPMLVGTAYEHEGHPVLVPGSNRDESYILRPLPGSVASLYSVNHGAGRRLSRGEAKRLLDQRQVDETYRRAGIVVNAAGPVPLDESSTCYKRSENVVGCVTSLSLAQVETRLWPLSSIKGDESEARKRGHDRRQEAKARDNARAQRRAAKLK
jgi:tRNA-splicing ligase RtcB